MKSGGGGKGLFKCSYLYYLSFMLFNYLFAKTQGAALGPQGSGQSCWHSHQSQGKLGEGWQGDDLAAQDTGHGGIPQPEL